jgi:hypothetical protein
MNYEKLLPEKQSSGDERGSSKPEQLRYLSNAGWFSKLTFGWIYGLVTVLPVPRSTVTDRT